MTKQKDFTKVVLEIWDSTVVTGSQMFKLSKKLKALKPKLRALNRDYYSDIQKKVVKAWEDLLCLQKEILISPLEDLILVK